MKKIKKILVLSFLSLTLLGSASNAFAAPASVSSNLEPQQESGTYSTRKYIEDYAVSFWFEKPDDPYVYSDSEGYYGKLPLVRSEAISGYPGCYIGYYTGWVIKDLEKTQTNKNSKRPLAELIK